LDTEPIFFSNVINLGTLNIIAFDTSTEYCSLALWLNSELQHKETLAGQQHSELLLPMLQALLAENNLALKQLDGFAFGAGPGSFTGLRIACGIAQGLAFATERPVAGISTLKALAQRVNNNKVVVALDARMGEIYHAAYEKINADDWKTVSKATVCLPNHAPSLTGNGWVSCGSGFDLYQQELTEHYGEQINYHHHGLYPHAREIAQLAARKFSNGSVDDPIHAAPVYIRNKVALKESER